MSGRDNTRNKESAPGSSAKNHRERKDQAAMEEPIMTSISTNIPALRWDGYEFSAYAELTSAPGGERVIVSTNWDKESIMFPVQHLTEVIDALQSLKHELTGKRG